METKLNLHYDNLLITNEEGGKLKQVRKEELELIKKSYPRIKDLSDVLFANRISVPDDRNKLGDRQYAKGTHIKELKETIHSVFFIVNNKHNRNCVATWDSSLRDFRMLDGNILFCFVNDKILPTKK